MPPQISCETPERAGWEWVDTVRQRVEEELAGEDEELRCVAVLAASELAENVVKYGDQCRSTKAGIEVVLNRDILRIRSTNCVSDPADAREVMDIVEGIQATSDPAALYVSQMQSVMRSSTAGSRLGFYRIAAEGGLRLSQVYVNGCLTITAERELS